MNPRSPEEAEDIYLDVICPVCDEAEVEVLPFIRFLNYGVLETLEDRFDRLSEEEADFLHDARDEIMQGNVYLNEWRVIWTARRVVSGITENPSYEHSKRSLDYTFKYAHSQGLKPLAADARIRAKLAGLDSAYLEVFEQYRANADRPEGIPPYRHPWFQ